MPTIAEPLVRPSAATLARRARFEHAKRLPASTAHWFYKHIDPVDKDPMTGELEKRIPHNIEDEARILDLRRSLDCPNKLTNQVFDGIAHLVYGWPHMGDAAALIALEEST